MGASTIPAANGTDATYGINGSVAISPMSHISPIGSQRASCPPRRHADTPIRSYAHTPIRNFCIQVGFL